MIATMAQPSPFVASTARADFEAVVRSEGRRLYTVALSVLRDRAEAEDAVQETMVKAWRSWGSLRDSDKRTAWLTRICINHCIGRKRSSWRRRFFSIDDAPQEPVDPRAQTAFDPVDPDLERACRLLTVKQRVVIALHYQQGYTLDECAAIIGCRPGTVRSHLGRALASLRKELHHE